MASSPSTCGNYNEDWKIEFNYLGIESEMEIRNHKTLEVSKCLQTLINFIQYQSDQLKLKKNLGLFIALYIKTLPFRYLKLDLKNYYMIKMSHNLYK